MAVYVNTNVSSLNGQRTLNNVNNSLNTTYQRLSTGLRINSAKDDSAGLQIADRMTSQINGLNQGNRNANDGIALAQTVESGMDEISSMLQKIRTLAVQASNGTNTLEDRQALAAEANSLGSEITRIAEQTKYGGKTILNGGDSADTIYGVGHGTGDQGKITFQVGANEGDTISLDVAAFTLSAIVDRTDVTNGTTDAIEANGTFKFSVVSSAAGEGVASVITAIDAMIADVDSQRASLGSIQNRLESSVRNQSNVSANQSDARSRIRDADFAEESANLTQQNIIQQAATSMLMQANSRPQLGLSLIG